MKSKTIEKGQLHGDVTPARIGKNQSLEAGEKSVRRRRPVEVRSRIVEAAIAVFTRDGFKGARMRTIADDAGVAIQLLMYHFKSKEQLWKVAMLQVLGIFETLHNARPLPASASSSDRLRRFISDAVHFNARAPQLHRIMTQETGQLTPRLVWIVDNWIRGRFDEFCTLVRGAQREGTVRQANPAHLYYAVLGIATMPFSGGAEYEYLTGKSPFTASEIERTIKLIKELMFFAD